MVVAEEIDGARIAAPLRVADVAIERAGERFGAAAIGVGDVEFGDGVVAAWARARSRRCGCRRAKGRALRRGRDGE